MDDSLMHVLTREGVLINVTVRYWRATKKLKPEDVGLDPTRIAERLISLGHKKLLPKEALQPFALIESRARGVIEAGTFPFLQGLSHFLPNAKLEAVNRQLDQLHAEFRQATTQFIANYAGTREQALVEWREAAQKLVADPERLLAAIEASFPDTAEVEKWFGFHVRLFQVRVPEQLSAELLSLGEQQQIIAARESTARQAQSSMRQELEGFIGECVTTLREQTAQLCHEMLESMQSGNSGVHQRTLNRLVKFIDEFKQLNFVGDREMETQLERVRQEFLGRSAEQYRDSAAATAELKNGLQALVRTAQDLAQQDTRELVARFGQMGHRRFHLVA